MSRRHQVILPGQGLAYNTIKPSRKPKKNKKTKGPGLIQGQNHRENQKKLKKPKIFQRSRVEEGWMASQMSVRPYVFFVVFGFLDGFDPESIQGL